MASDPVPAEDMSDMADPARNQPQQSATVQVTHRWILNNLDGPHGIQLRGTVEEVSKTIRPGPLVLLLPGYNLVEIKEWDQAKQNPMVKKLLAERIKPSKAPEQKSERVGHKMLSEGPEVASEDPTGSLKVDDLLPMIEEFHDHRLLQRSLQVEKRPRVQAALQERLDYIDPRKVKARNV